MNTRGENTAILMDFGGTLDADGVHWAPRFHAVYKQVGGSLPLNAFEPIFRESDRGLARLPQIRTMGFRATIDAQTALLRALLPDGHRVDTTQMAERFHADALRTVTRNRDTLDALREYARLAVISNFTGNLEPCLSELGILEYFDVVSDSTVEGVMKPDPLLFLHTLHKMGVPAQDAWIVGDNFEADIRPAQALGLQTCWLAPAERAAPENCEPTARVRRFTDILDVVGCTV